MASKHAASSLSIAVGLWFSSVVTLNRRAHLVAFAIA